MILYGHGYDALPHYDLLMMENHPRHKRKRIHNTTAK